MRQIFPFETQALAMWKTELKYLWWEFWYQISFFWYPHGSYRWQRRAQYFKAFLAHVKRERAKMYQPYGRYKTLWLYVMDRDKWTCQIQKRRICTQEAKQVDHIKPVSKWFFSTPDNLQAACSACNKWKGIKIL